MEFGCADFSSLQRREMTSYYMVYISGQVWLTVFLSLVTGLMYSPAGVRGEG